MIADLFRGLRQFGSESRRRKRSIARIEQSDLFDRRWYLETYSDVRDSGFNPARHYLESGWKEGRDPSPKFCTTAYLKANSDVAALGINPLLHYLEHGHAEGRGAPQLAGPLRAVIDPIIKFGEAAPCMRFPVPQQPSVRWARAGRIDPTDAEAIEVDGLVVAKAGNRSDLSLFNQALSELAWLSGSAAEPPELQEGRRTALDLADAWHAGRGVFRTRWRPAGNQPVVVRAIQHLGDRPTLVGEACVAGELDLVDARLVNPLFPLLFVFTEPDGRLLGVQQLTFPSLCRGGLHYLEMVADAGAAGADVGALDSRLAERLVELRQGRSVPLVGELSVDLEGADGTHPLFQPEFRAWLRKVMHVGMSASGGAADAAADFLRRELALEAGAARSQAAARLLLAGDMIPTIAALTAPAELATGTRNDLVGSLIVASADAAGASTCIRVPPGMNSADFGGSTRIFPIIAPREGFDRLSGKLPLLAIRQPPKRPATEAELLAPSGVRGPAEAVGAQSISWLIWPGRWAGPELGQSLEALAEQLAATQWIIFVGEPAPEVADVAGRLFGGRVRWAADAAAASALIDTSLVGYLGAGVILHDRRSVERLSQLVDEPNAASATALVLFAERRGKGALVVPAEGNHLPDARLFPAAILPLAAPPRDLWVARAELARKWLAGDIEAPGHHLCSTSVSVSRLSRAASADPPLRLPRSERERAITAELVIG